MGKVLAFVQLLYNGLMVKNKNILISYKLLFGLLGFAAVVTEIATLVERGTFNPVNFFSFFTIQNNILISLAFFLSALAIAAGKKSRALDVFRTFTTVFIVVVGVGFALLLAGLEGVVLTAVPWDNTVLHYIIPVAAGIDFLIDKPKTKLRFAPSLVWLIYPLAYLAYSMVRGAATGWYPYPFLNPASNSLVSITITIVGLILLGLVLIWGACWFTRRKG